MNPKAYAPFTSKYIVRPMITAGIGMLYVADGILRRRDEKHKQVFFYKNDKSGMRSDRNEPVIEDEPEMLLTDVLDTSNWMFIMRDSIGERRIQDIVIPGSHDSCTYSLSTLSEYSPDSKLLFKRKFDWPVTQIVATWSRTQRRNIAQQLCDGIRYFDLRICKKPDGSLWTCHGQYCISMTLFINTVALFLRHHKWEWIILDFNHFYTIFPEDHARLQRDLMTAFDGYIWPREKKDCTLNEMWRTMGHGGVICVYHDVSRRDTPFWQGIVHYATLHSCVADSDICSPWPNRPTIDELYPRVVECLQDHKSKCSKLFVSQLILSPNLKAVAGSILRPGKKLPASLESYADTLNLHLVDWVTNLAKQYKFNILMLDFYDSCNIIDVALRLNLKPD